MQGNECLNECRSVCVVGVGVYIKVNVKYGEAK